MATDATEGASVPAPTTDTGSAANSTASRPSAPRPTRPAFRPGSRTPRPGGARGGRRFGRPKACPLCIEKAKEIDYKDAAKLGRFISDRGRMETRRRTGMCAKHQRMLSQAIKRARHLALLPYTASHIYATGGVGIVERPPKPKMPRREPVAVTQGSVPAPTPEREESAQENISAKEA